MQSVAEAVLGLIFSLIDLLRGSIPFAIIFFLLALVARHIRARIQKKLGVSWTLSAFITSFAFSFVAVLFAYLMPYLLASQFASLGVIPEELRPELSDIVYSFMVASFKIIVCAAFIAFFSMPFLFLGSYVCAVLERRKFNKHFALFIATYIATVILFALLLSLLQPIFLGLFYFLY